MTNRYRILCAISVLLLAAYACALPLQTAPPSPTTVPPTAAPSDTPLPPPTSTASLAPTVPQPDTETPTLEGPTATATLETGVLPTDTPTATLVPITAKLTRTSDCFNGPAGNYDLVATFPNGTKLMVIGRDLGGTYIFIQDPSSPTTECYLLAANAQLSSDPTVLPQNTAIPSPTGSAGISASFKHYDNCKSVYTLFTIVNTGGSPLRSAYIKVTDLKTGQFTEWSADAFDLWQGCIIAQNYSPLNPGSTGYLRSGQFVKNPRGDKMRANIEACTQKGLKGFCVSTTVLFQ